MSTTPLALDEFDHRLLELLQRDADATLSALGDEVGLSASAVQRRIKRYRESGLMPQVARTGTPEPMALQGNPPA